MRNYRGIRGIEFVWHGAWADPELKYKNRLFNYWDIEEAIFDEFKEWAKEYGVKVNSENEDTLFDEYCRNDNGAAVKNYLDDYIFAGGGVLV